MLTASIWSIGCEINTGDQSPGGGAISTPPDFGGGFGGGFGVDPAFPGAAGAPGVTTTAAKAPPAISGGTLLITRDGQYAVAADPDRDQVSIVDLNRRVVLHTVLLEAGDEPGRLVEDASGRVHVALRRGGALVSIDLVSGQVLSRRNVCGAPRGLAYETETDQIHVACSGGELVSFAASGGDPVRSLELDIDLRDVIATSTGLMVSRFKSAELLRLDASGNVVNRGATKSITRATEKMTLAADGSSNTKITPEALDAEVAWRTVQAPDGSITMLHQYALSGPVVIEEPNETADPSNPNTPALPPIGGGGSAYGAPPGMCGGIVQTGVSHVTADGRTIAGLPILGMTLGVDAAVSPDSVWVAVASAGGAVMDFSTPTMGTVSVFPNGTSVGDEAAPDFPVGCARAQSSLAVQGQPTSVAFNPTLDPEPGATDVWLVVQTREPAGIVVFHDPFTAGVALTLSGASELDTGHEMFHRDAGAGIACASCHAEGEEDGRVWQFDPIGPRRTQAIDVGLEGTAPFHWDGDMANFDQLVSEVMVHRMGGQEQSQDRRDSLAHWIFALTPRASVGDPASDAAVRGRAIFASTETGCTTCHQGEKLTSNVSAFVGTTEAGHLLQVPSLKGVAYRAPFLHDGRAKTLRERFDPKKGGGDLHGHTSQLSEAALTDLVAYLESI
jgi:cytochrome c553